MIEDRTFSIIFNKNWTLFLKVFQFLFLIILFLSSAHLYAEGSKDLYPSGATGNRAYLYSNSPTSAVSTPSFPFRTLGTHYVYAVVGETIMTGSSAQGIGNGIIRITSPSGLQTSSTLKSVIGQITNRADELGGPKYSGQGAGAKAYDPFTATVGAGETGIWTVEFLPTGDVNSSTSPSTPSNTPADGAWTQPTGSSVIAAWDVSVRNASNTNWISGRVYTNVLNLMLYNNFAAKTSAYFGSNYVLTKDGRAYRVQNNGNNGLGFTFFSNNKGFIDANGQPTYKSLNTSVSSTIVASVQDPRIEDDASRDLVTHKLFYGPPAADLPKSAPVMIGSNATTTWLKNDPIVPVVSNIKFTGSEGTLNQASQKGGYISFTTNVSGSYRIILPTGTNTRVLSGAAVAGLNSVRWDGKDGLGTTVGGGLLTPEIKVRLASAEVHFPFIDMEINPQGIIIELTENSLQYLVNLNPSVIDESVYSDRVYWDDSDITTASTSEKSNPQVNNVNGASSKTNGHIWGSYSASSGTTNSGKGSNSYGNEKSMDTYTYIVSKEESVPVTAYVKVADLKISSIVTDISQLVSNNKVTYTIKVKNAGPSDVTDAKVAFKAPAGFSILNVGYASSCSSIEHNAVNTGAGYQANLDLSNNCEVTYTIVGTIDAALKASAFQVEASIMRPKDVTDPDATNTIFDLAPVDPHQECSNGTGTELCNNIKYATVNAQSICLNSAIASISYILATGGTNYTITGTVPAGIAVSFDQSARKVTLTGTPTQVGEFNFSITTQGSDQNAATFNITVSATPATPVISATSATTFCQGDQVTLTTSAATGNQWYKDGMIIAGATGTTYVATASGKYTVVAANTNGCAAPVSNEIVVVVNPLPTAPVIQAGSTTVFCEGSQVTLTSSAASGNQWYKDGIIIGGATGSSYIATTSGKYTVVFTNGSGCFVTSNEIAVLVNPLPTTPVVSASGNTGICEGNSVVLTSSAATGNQWYKDGVIISGATASTYTAALAGKYSVVATNSNNCAAPPSNEIQIIVNALPATPVITAATTTTFCEGGQVLLTSSAATGYQWYKDGAIITGATSSSYTATASGKYSVVVINANNCSAAPSNEIQVVVNLLPPIPVITAGTSTTFCEGSNVVLTSSAATGYQWFKDGVIVTGATSSTYTATASGKYSVVVTNENNCAAPNSNEILVTVNPLPITPVVTAGTNTTFCEGGSVVLTSSPATGYQWFKDGVIITGATSSTYTATASGKYSVVVTNANNCSAPASNEITVVVNPLPEIPVITAGTTTTFCEGGQVVLTSSSASNYQWFKDGAIISGATGSTYTATASGRYSVMVTNANSCSAPASNEITVVVNPLPETPVITAGTNTTFCEGSSVVLTSSAATGNQWYKDGVIIPGATASTYTATLAGKYSVVVTNSNNCAAPLSNEIQIIINALPATPVITAATTTTFCEGGQVLLTSSAATGYQWYKDGAIISGATSSTYTAKASGKFSVMVTNTNNCAAPASNEITVVVNPLPATPVVTAGTTTTFCEGGSVVLSSSPAAGYQWYEDGAIISGATSSTYTATASGKYSVVATNENNCAAPNSNEITVVVNLLPATPVITAGTPTTFCEGGSVVLTSSPAAGYQWFKDGAIINGANGSTYSATASGKYSVIVTNENNCAAPNSNEITVLVNPLPATPLITAGTNTNFCEGGSVILTSSAATGNQWLKDGAIINGATSSTYTATASGKYSVIVTNSNNCAAPNSNEILVTVNPLPATPTITAATTTTFCDGGLVVLTSSSATGYQWFKDGAIITGATSSTYTATASGKYSVIVTNSNNCAAPNSNEILVTVNPLPATPTITAATTTTFCEGSSVVLTSSAATGNQWLKDGVIITGATSSTYTATASGKYSVVVTNANNCAAPNSNEILVTVNPLPATPTITAATTTTFCEGGLVVLTSSSATGYQWYKDGAIITGATSSTYTATASGKYSVVVTNANNCAAPNSNEILVTVNPLPETPVITAGTNTNFCEGGSVVLTSSAATGYQWFKDGAIVSGATGSTYTAIASGKYSVIVTNSNNCAAPNSNEILVTVNPLPATPVITAGTNTNFCEGGSVVLTSSPAAGYQWYKDGAIITGATSSTYSATASGKYSVVVTNANNCAAPASNAIQVIVNPLPVTPLITAATTTTFCEGGLVVLTSSAATGYQWLKDGVIITGATGSTYSATASGKYSVVVTNENNCAAPNSNEILVTVNPLPATPVITAGTNTNFCEGGSVVLTSSPAAGYQWYKDGAIITGATSSTYSATASGKYSVKVTNTNNCAAPPSNEITVIVNPLPAIPVITAGTSTNFCEGGSVVLTSSGATAYQWYKDGAIISGATSSTYRATASGKYSVVVTNSNNCAAPNSNEITIVVNPLPATPVITAGTNTNFCEGGSVVLTSSAATGYQWFKDGAIITGATSSTYTATASGKYSIIVNNENNCAAPPSNEIQITVNALPATPVITAGTSTNFCEGGIVVLTSSPAAGYQWFKNGDIITSATSSTYTATASGKYSVVVTNENNCAAPGSNEIAVIVNPLPATPVITASTPTSFCEGAEVILNSNATVGNQWFKDGVIITGATASTYLAKVTGKYSVVVTNENSCAAPISNEILVTVNPLPATPIITAATTTTFCEGGQVVLTSSSAAKYQWFKNGIIITGAINSSYTATTPGKYSVIVNNENNCAAPTSNEIMVTVNPLPSIPVVTAETTANFCEGGKVVLTSSSASGYQWYKDGNILNGATGSTYTATASGKYNVVVTNESNCAAPASNQISVVVNPLPATPIVTPETTTTFCIGAKVALRSSSETGNQWYKDGNRIAGATGTTYTATTAGKYSVVVTNETNCVAPVSNEILVIVNPLPAIPVINAAGPLAFCAGGQVTLTSSLASGYQWYQDGVIITGANESTYTAKASGKYHVVVTNETNCAAPASNELTVMVNPLPATPVIVAGTTTNFCEGGQVILKSSSAAGYQWYKDGTLISGATQAMYTASLAGKYSVVVANESGCTATRSNDITVVVNPLPAAPIIKGETDLIFCEGGAVVLSSSATTGNQWYKDGLAISGATGSTYTANASGKYSVAATNGNGCTGSRSNELVVVVNPLPEIPVVKAGSSTTYCEGGQVVLSSSATSGNQWLKDDNPIQGATGQTYIATTSGSFTVLTTNSNGCVSLESSPVIVKEVPLPVMPGITPGGVTSFCEGGFVTLTSSSSAGNQWYKDGILIQGATQSTLKVTAIGYYTVKVTNETGCGSAISASTWVNVNKLPKGFDDKINTLTCSQSSFNYDLQQQNLNNLAKGGNAVQSVFTWTTNNPAVLGANNGSGSNLSATLINTTTLDQDVVYMVTPRNESGGCPGLPFTITVHVPVCNELSFTKTADKSVVSKVGEKITYTIIVSNTGHASHTQVRVNDPLLGGYLYKFTGDNGNNVLEKDEVWTYQCVYTLTQSDFDDNGKPVLNNGKIINTAILSSAELAANQSAIAEVQLQPDPSVRLVKTGVLSKDFKTVGYTFNITNTGNLTLKDVEITDPKLSNPIVIHLDLLAPGAVASVNATYVVSDEEKIKGSVRNTATVLGLTSTGLPVRDISGTAMDNDDPTVVDIVAFPAALNDYAKTKADVPVSVPVANNDQASLFPLDVASIKILNQPSNGSVQILANGQINYIPNKGYFGTERFSYKILDSVGFSSNEALVVINIVPPDLDIPNTFTPNGDGRNDTFQIKGRENYDSIDLVIYNRWGDEVYRRTNYKDEWDGGNLNEGTYYYVLRLKKGNTEESRKSWILLKR